MLSHVIVRRNGDKHTVGYWLTQTFLDLHREHRAGGGYDDAQHRE